MGKAEITTTLCNMNLVNSIHNKNGKETRKKEEKAETMVALKCQLVLNCCRYNDAIWLLQSLHYSGISKETHSNKFVLCLDQWEQSLKSVSKQISAATDSLSLHILLSVKRREGSTGWGGESWVKVTRQSLSRRASLSQPDHALLQAWPSLYWIPLRHHPQS